MAREALKKKQRATTHPRLKHILKVLECADSGGPHIVVLVFGPLRLQDAREEEAPSRRQLLVDGLQAAEGLYPVEVELRKEGYIGIRYNELRSMQKLRANNVRSLWNGCYIV